VNLYQCWHETALRLPNQPAIVGPGEEAAISYRALDEAICRTSEMLTAVGVGPGSCVGLHYPSGREYIVHTYAIWRAGGCVVPIPTELAAAEKSEICRRLAIDFVISKTPAPAFVEPFARTAQINLGEDVLLPIASPRQHPAGFAEVNAAFIRFTSGTTGASKGVVLSHETIHERICGANQALAIDPDDRVLWVLSMAYHFTVSIVAYLTFGATIVLPANHFAAAILAAIQRQRATLLYASPTHYALLADYPQAAPLASLRLAISTTSSLGQDVAVRFAERYERPISQALGIIEVGLPCIDVDPAPEHWGSVGHVLPPYRLRLDEMGLGPEHREILLSGPGFLDAYYDPWLPRREILEDGWFRTGDVGSVDADGQLFLRGRASDVINVMGMKFFPQEVERVLTEHPLVQAAGVFGSHDQRWGEAVHARLVTHGAADLAALESELRQLCRRQLAAYKVPQRIEFVAALPRTASGKILHRAG
jgi:long-chain acyl-CoA synthetase